MHQPSVARSPTPGRDPNRIFDFRESGRSLDVLVPETEALADPRALRRCASGVAIREAEAIVV
jgi:hypothetical protein